MYKVFIENRCLKIIPPEQFENEMCSGAETYLSDNEITYTLNSWLIGNKANDICVVSGLQPNVLLQHYFPSIKYVRAAGGIVYNEKKEMLFFRKNNFWDLPKGHCDKNETPEATCIREVCEETGLFNPSIKKYAGTTWHCYKLNGKLVLKQTYWFTMEAGQYNDLQADINEGISDLCWIDENKLSTILAESHRSISDFIQDMHKTLLS